ncbi:hypothetical protein KC622_00930 [Candidatus Dojkabacteria bacterium]|uniref:Uncharacterized protein n=1 Tax=Candidatus Dojkabacteria bacterium TaxID=2099670 RepID=A0A955HYE4_9BACT|nr:hypothetical protein [Candidatus Dojkabacteria bacterium]MCB9790626.1 hypothetical protein [Candidatus Nomurabacteria bacterium]
MNRKETIWKIESKFDYRIPLRGNNRLYVEVGDNVAPGSKLFNAEHKKLMETYHLPSLLGIKADNVKDYVGRINGEYISKGDLIAERLMSGGLASKRVISGSDGIVSLTRVGSGYVDILSESEDKEVTSPVNGTVSEISLNNYISLSTSAVGLEYEVSKNLEKPGSPLNGQIQGELELIGNGDSVYTEKDLNSNYSDKIVFAGRYLPLDLLIKLYERDCSLVLAYSLDYLDYKKTDMPVVILGGFGQLSLPKEILKFFQKAAGKHVVIPTEEDSHVYFLLDRKQKGHINREWFASGIERGAFVRALEPSSFGFTGEVVSVDPEEGVDYIVAKDLKGKSMLLDQDTVVEINKLEKL